MMSGFRDEWTTGWNCSCVDSSTLISQPCAIYRIAFLVLLGTEGLSSALINWMAGSGVQWVCHFLSLSRSTMLARAWNTWSCCHLYLLWLTVVLQPDRMWSINPFFPQNLYCGSSLSPLSMQICSIVYWFQEERNPEGLQLPEFSRVQVLGDLPLFKLPGMPDWLLLPSDFPSLGVTLLLGSSLFSVLRLVFSVAVGGSKSLSSCTWVPNGVLQLKCTFGLCQRCLCCPFTLHPDLVFMPALLTCSLLQSLHVMVTLHHLQPKWCIYRNESSPTSFYQPTHNKIYCWNTLFNCQWERKQVSGHEWYNTEWTLLLLIFERELHLFFSMSSSQCSCSMCFQGNSADFAFSDSLTDWFRGRNLHLCRVQNQSQSTFRIIYIFYSILYIQSSSHFITSPDLTADI